MSKSWYVVYTAPKAEKKIAKTVSDLGIESYLPLYTSIRKWSDRKKKVELPLFPNYVFVKTENKNRFELFNVHGILKFVSVQRNPVVVRENVIEMIRKAMDHEFEVLQEDYFQTGTEVLVKEGQLSGLTGVVLKQNGSSRVMLRIEKLQKAFSINIPTQYLEQI